VQNDLLGASPNGEFFATSNFHTGTSTLYTHEGEKISRVKDLPFTVGGFAHGVRFYDDTTLGLTSCSGPNRGAHLFDIHTGDHLLGVAIPRKCQDIVFVSPSRMLILTVTGNPTFQPVPIYDAEIWVVDFDMKKRWAKVLGHKVFHKSHFDAGMIYDEKLYITDQYNNHVLVLTPNSFDVVAKLGKYDFPHGIDIRRDLLAITNYGASSLTINPLPAALLSRPEARSVQPHSAPSVPG